MGWREEHLHCRSALFDGLKENGRRSFDRFLKSVLDAGQEPVCLQLYSWLACTSSLGKGTDFDLQKYYALFKGVADLLLKQPFFTCNACQGKVQLPYGWKKVHNSDVEVFHARRCSSCCKAVHQSCDHVITDGEDEKDFVYWCNETCKVRALTHSISLVVNPPSAR